MFPSCGHPSDLPPVYPPPGSPSYAYDPPAGDDDADSAFGDSLIDDETKTLASYITEYRYEFGRRYHAYRDGAYWVSK